MRVLLGFGLLAAGVLFGAQIYRQPEDPFARVQVTSAPARAQPPAAEAQKGATLAPDRTFSPRLPAFATEVVAPRAASPVGQPAEIASAPISAAPSAPAPAPSAVAPVAVPAAQPAVTSWPVVVSVDAGSISGQKRAAKPGDDAARRELVRSLQTEMRRVGCYEGELSGQWTPGTKRALGAFVARLNASLPVEEPDYILLALARSQTASVCGKGCPADQGLADDGRCVPKAILAQQAARKGKPAERPAVVAAPRTSPAVAEAPSVVVQPAAIQPASRPHGRRRSSGYSDNLRVRRRNSERRCSRSCPRNPFAFCNGCLCRGRRKPESPRKPKRPPRERPHLRSTSGTRAVVDIFTNPLGRN